MTVWRTRVASGARTPEEMLVEAEPSSTVADLAGALRQQGYAVDGLAIDGRVVPSDQTLAQVGLVHGSSVDLGTTPPVRRPSTGRYVMVVAGPDTGRWIELRTGHTATVGRGGSCDLPLSDSLLSGLHLAITWSTGGELLCEDRESTNGTLLEGERLTAPAVVRPGEYLQAGTSVITVVDIAEDDLATLPQAIGASVPFQRRFREAAVPPPASLKAPQAPGERSSGMGTSWLRMAAPLIGGVAMAVLSGRWIFLVVVAISPIIFVVDNIRRKKKRAQEEVEEREGYHAAVETFLRQHAAHRSEELGRARSLAGPGGIAALHALVRHRRLWERSSTDADFGSITVGLCEGQSTIKIEGDLPDDRPAVSTLWCHPLTHSLIADGPLAVVGPTARSRAVARSMVLELATAHSPADLVIWVLTTEGAEDDWNCLRWLPHTFVDEHSVRVAASAQTRASLVSDLQRMITNRRGAADSRDRLMLPVHVVVVDGVSSIPGSDLTEILVDGSSVGVTGIVVDAELVPEGTRGRLGIGEFADVASFASRTQPHRQDVISFEITAQQADASSRRLAGLRPATAAVRSGGGSVRLLDLASANGPTAEMIAARWNALPTSRTVVGVDGDVPISIDIMRDGPHGLVGGTTRSGKTEFLKTFLMGLALNNHPDDLAIAIIDFKGGVDHEVVADLPHVIGLSTNNDIDSFTRATALLNAELVRRQELFREAGAANLDAYRGARDRIPSLLRIPRLIVVVDEFGELLASESGKASLGQLESITRIGGGLGVHLLLVTQNFENQLPAQIAANAGLRVCFRVQHPSHSKIVLDSDVASTIPAARVGRAFVRSHGGALQEFQSARVAGPRPGAVIDASGVRLTRVPFGAAASVTPATLVVDVPVNQTDMFDLVNASKQAAQAIGWNGPVVPWPEPLPDVLPLGGLLETAQAGSAPGAWPIGLADRPEAQRHEVSAFGRVGDLTLCIGGPRAGLADVMQAIAVSGALLKPASELHLYVIDQLGQGLASLARLPHCGAVATRNDPLAQRIVTFVSREVARRKAEVLRAGASNVDELGRRTGRPLPDILLMVHGADRLLMFGENAASPLLSPLLTLVSELGGSGVGVVLSGLPPVAYHRLGAAAVRRLVFALPDKQDLVGLDVERPLAGQLNAPGRCFDSSTRRVMQIATIQPDEDVAATEIIEALGERLAELEPTDPRDGPIEVRDVPWPLPWEQAPGIDPPRDLLFPMALAVSIETASYGWLDVEEDGPVIAVTGSARSGRSGALVVAARVSRALGHRVIGTSPSRRSPLAAAAGIDLDAFVQPDRIVEALAAHQRNVVVIDDLHRWGDDVEPLEKLLAYDGEIAIVVAAPISFLDSRNEVTRVLGSIRSALVLAPTNQRDGDAFGLRRINDEVLQDNRPGRGVLVVAGEAAAAQVPFIVGPDR